MSTDLFKTHKDDVLTGGARVPRPIGVSVPRREDARHLTGAGQFLADIHVPDMHDVAFVRSDVAHGNLLNIEIPDELRGTVFTYADLGDVRPLEGRPDNPAFQNSVYTPLATDKVRFVGQSIAACVAPTRALAEDMAEQVSVEFEELPAVVDAVRAMVSGSPLLHEHWPDNAYFVGGVSGGDIAQARRQSAHKIPCKLRMNRQVAMHLEGRGVLAYWDPRQDELVVYLSTQSPHTARYGLALFLGLPEHKVRVVAPDIGGGFGGKGRLVPEEFVVAALALRLRHPVRWIEDRREHFLASIHARDHHYDLMAYASKDGRILGIEGSIHVNAGAYALWPGGAIGEASLASRNMPGAYRIGALELKTYTVATNKAPMGAYRGVGRPGACFAMERIIDEVARALNRDPVDIRRINLIEPGDMPYRTIAGELLDTGNYRAALDKAAAMINVPSVRDRQKQGEGDGRRIGMGFSIYAEQSGHGTAEWAKRNARLIYGFDCATVRMLPDGSVYIYAGIQDHGQGLGTTMAQVAAAELGIPMDRISVRFGDTSVVSFGFGTFGSRSAIFGGGAIAKACQTLKRKILQIGAHLLSEAVEKVEMREGRVHGRLDSVSVEEVAHVAHMRADRLPAGLEPRLETTANYEPSESGGVYSYGVHAVVLAVDPPTGKVDILDYVVVEDCGTMINPRIVDGQVIGGVAQGIGTALYEEASYDEFGQPTATTLGDYLVPGALEMPRLRIDHLVSPATATTYGQKGVGEGGTIGAPAAVINAIADAFRDTGALFGETPLTPRRITTILEETGFFDQEDRT